MSNRSKGPDSTDRDQQILSRLARIEHKVDSLDQTTAFALRADYARHQQSLIDVFGNRVRLAQVYLAADGSRNVQGIAAHLGMKAQNVSRELVVLKDQGLLELGDSNGGGDIYAKKAVDRTLRITPFLCEHYSLERNGTPTSQGARSRKGTAGDSKARQSKPKASKPKAKLRRK